MRRLRWVPAAVLLVGAVEFLIFLWLSAQIGPLRAVLLVVALSVLGIVLMRREGMSAWRRLRAARQGGDPRGEQALDALVGLAAALLLVIPGLLTGLLGLLLLIPPVRRAVRARARVATEKRIPAGTANSVFGPRRVRVSTTTPPHHPPVQTPGPVSNAGSGPSEVIEGEIVD
ncbi:FxsA family protein [Catellatospora tritici]|uniref:FxsA family protein n=1 Tax=Catellatospora tritici TaxID=2851566 RepID=UPI001C2DB572|nr:FxsA family protein [Catellatospora tritici]MBV1850876.1 FxsA family protein [Catellatospora tritici]MBV1851129.1 FxsA family protein [Catellatospora tritici]